MKRTRQNIQLLSKTKRGSNLNVKINTYTWIIKLEKN